jgi:quercetin dioxygenase-like cupin family protein
MSQPAPQIHDLATLAAASTSATAATGPIWSLASADLNLNLLHFTAGDGVPDHVNAEVDVAGLVIAGTVTVEIDGRAEALRPGCLFFIPKGARRAIRAGSDDFAYLTCHRRRAGLMPERKGRS